MAMKKGQSGNPNGRPPGIPNKATQQAREAIALFVDCNAHRLQEWLDQIATGTKNSKGKTITPPNPARAAELFIGVIEYHVPKLARTTIAGDKDNPLSMTHEILGLTKDEKQRLIDAEVKALLYQAKSKVDKK